MICKNCGKTIGDDSTFCQGCGALQATTTTVQKSLFSISGDTTGRSGSVPGNKTVSRHFGGWKLAAFLCGIVFLFAVVGKVVPVSKIINSGPNDSTVIGCAESCVKEQLKAPSTAQFSNTRVVDHDKYGRYIVYAEVDAQNSFGAYLHSKYVVLIWNVQADGKYIYNTALSVQSLDSLDESSGISLLKDMLDWNKPLPSESGTES